MTDIVAISKKGAKVFPQTHYLAILELDKHVKSLIPDQVDTSSFVTSGSMSEYVLNQLKSYATTADLNAAIANVSTVEGDTGNQVLDTRSTNQTPGWYKTNNPKTVVTEFKQTTAIGITQALMPSGQTLGIYCSLTTETPWIAASGGSAFQTAKLVDQTRPIVLIRVGISDTAWSDWELVTTRQGASI